MKRPRSPQTGGSIKKLHVPSRFRKRKRVPGLPTEVLDRIIEERILSIITAERRSRQHPSTDAIIDLGFVNVAFRTQTIKVLNEQANLYLELAAQGDEDENHDSDCDCFETTETDEESDDGSENKVIYPDELALNLRDLSSRLEKSCVENEVRALKVENRVLREENERLRQGNGSAA